MSKEGQKEAVISITKVRHKLKEDCSWLRRNQEETEKQDEKPWIEEVRASRVNGAPIETSPVSSPTKPTLSPTEPATQREPTSGFMIRGIFKGTAVTKPAANGKIGTTTFTKKPSDSYKKIAPYTVKPTVDNQESTLSPEEREKRTVAASSVLKTSGRDRSFVLSAAKIFEAKAEEPGLDNNTVAFVAKRVEITDDEENRVAPAAAVSSPTSTAAPITPVAVAPQPKARKPSVKKPLDVAVKKPEEPKVLEDPNPVPPKQDPAPVSLPVKDPFEDLTPGCTKVATPLPELITEAIEAIHTEPEPEETKFSGKVEESLVDLAPVLPTPVSPTPASPPAVPVGPTPVSPTLPPAVPLRPTPVSPTLPPAVPFRPAPVSPTLPPAVPLRPTPVSPTLPPAVPLRPAPVSPTLPPAVPLRPAPVSPTLPPAVPLRPTPESPTLPPAIPLRPTPESPTLPPAIPLRPAPVSPTLLPAVPLSPTPVSPTPPPAVPLSPTPVSPTPQQAVPLSPTPLSPTPPPAVPLSPTPVSPTPPPAVPLSPTPVSPTPPPAVPLSPTPIAPKPVQQVPLSPTPVTFVKEISVKTEPEPETISEPSPEPSSTVDTLSTLSDTLISFNTRATSVKDDEPELAEKKAGPADSHTTEDGVEKEPQISNYEPMTEDLLALTVGPKEPAEPVPPNPRHWSQDLLSGVDGYKRSSFPPKPPNTDESTPAKTSGTLDLLADEVTVSRKEERSFSTQPWEEKTTDETAKETQSSTETVTVTTKTVIITDKSEGDIADPWSSRLETTTVTKSSSADPFDPYPIGTTSPNSFSDLLQPLADISINRAPTTSTTTLIEKKDPSPETKISTRRSWAHTWDTSTTQQTYPEEESNDTKLEGPGEDQNTMVTFERKSKDDDSPWDRWTSPTVYNIATTDDEEEQEQSLEDTQRQTVTTITTIREKYSEVESTMDRYDTYTRTVKEEEDRRVPTPEPETKKGFVYVKEYLDSTDMSLHNGADRFQSTLTSTCNYCGKQVGNDAKISIEHLNINCHPSCFECGVCGKPMGDLLFSMFLHAGKVHCEDCYSKV